MGKVLMKYISVFLVGLLIVVVVGRFYAEAQVRAGELAMEDLREEEKSLSLEIERVRLDVEVLENAGRLSELNASQLALGTVRAEQLLDDRDFATVLGLSSEEIEDEVHKDADVIGNVIGMIDPAMTEKAVNE